MAALICIFYGLPKDDRVASSRFLKSTSRRYRNSKKNFVRTVLQGCPKIWGLATGLISRRKIIRFRWNFVHSSRFWTGWTSRDQKYKSCIGQTPSSSERISCFLSKIMSALMFISSLVHVSCRSVMKNNSSFLCCFSSHRRIQGAGGATPTSFLGLGLYHYRYSRLCIGRKRVYITWCDRPD